MTIRTVQLRDIAEVRLGRQRSPKNHAGPNMRAYLRAANVGWEGLKLDDVKTMNFSDDEMGVYRLRYGDLLLSEASGSPAEVGKAALWTDEIADCGFQNTLLRVRPFGADSRYLLHYFRHQAIDGAFARHSRGVGIHHLGQAALAKWQVPLPTSDEQRRIVAVLDEAEALRARRTHAVTLLDQLSRSIFLDMFGDPVRNDRGWPTVRVDEAGTVQLGRQRAPKYQTGNATRPYVRVANVYENRIDLSDVLSMDFDESDFEKYRLRIGDVLLNEGQSTELVGRPAIWGGEIEDCCFQNTLVRFQGFEDSTDPRFALGVFLHYFRAGEFAKISSKTSSVAHLGAARFARMPFPLPPLELQREYARRFGRLGEVRRAHRTHLAQLDALLAALRHRAFRGELWDAPAA